MKNEFEAHPALFESLFATSLIYIAQSNFNIKALEMSMLDTSFIFMAIFLIRLGTRAIRHIRSNKSPNK